MCANAIDVRLASALDVRFVTSVGTAVPVIVVTAACGSWLCMKGVRASALLKLNVQLNFRYWQNLGTVRTFMQHVAGRRRIPSPQTSIYLAVCR
eukprot:3118975-Pleurochrysis_carterae.AAC.5